MSEKKYRPATLAVHAGVQEDGSAKAVGTPIYQTATFYLTDDIYQAMQRGLVRDEYIYTRYGNPTQKAAAQKIAALEGAESGLVFSSGMAAITSTLLAFLQPGDHLASARDLYGGTHAFMHDRLPPLNIQVSFFDTEDLKGLKEAIRPNTRVVYFETLTNPLLKVADVEALTQAAHDAGAIAVVDNTFPTPINLRPLEWGVDLVVHSGSKYLNGHGDLICGAVVGSREHTDLIWKNLLAFGGCLDPTAAFHLERGLKTLAIRMDRHNANSLQIANWLAEQPSVEQVYHPFLASNPRRTIALKYLRGGSGMVSFRLKGGDEQALKFLQHLRLFKVAGSLGGVESLVSLPMNTSHAHFTADERAQMGILPGTARLSVGIEDAEDLRDDLAYALNQLKF
jgi:cystathionine beta-lyase/cystathionine gamma-synthase